MRGALAEYERAKIMERTQRGRIGRAKAGHVWGGNPPYGYRDVGGEHTGRWEVDDREAAVARQIFAWCLEGLPLLQIARRLTQLRIPSPLDAPEPDAPRVRLGSRKRAAYAVWAQSSVRMILKNPTYTGCAYHNKRQYRREGPSRRRYAWRDQADWIALIMPAIISAVRSLKIRQLSPGWQPSMLCVRGDQRSRSSGQEHGDDPRQKNAIKRAGATDGDDRCTQRREVLQIEQVGAD
jgi:site-specific DNA recombinase